MICSSPSISCDKTSAILLLLTSVSRINWLSRLGYVIIGTDAKACLSFLKDDAYDEMKFSMTFCCICLRKSPTSSCFMNGNLGCYLMGLLFPVSNLCSVCFVLPTSSYALENKSCNFIINFSTALLCFLLILYFYAVHS